MAAPTITVTITSPAGSACDMVTYLKNADTTTPLTETASDYFLNDTVDTVLGSKLHVQLHSSAGDLTYSGNVITGR